jgi:8-oxo-dGTP diphosphatase
MTGPRVRVAALLQHDDGLLLVRQEKDGRGYWLLPGGGVELGETMEDALARELAEECGIGSCRVIAPVLVAESIAPGPAGPFTKHVVHLVYEVDVGAGVVEHVASRDGAVTNHRLFRRDEIAQIDLRPPIARHLARWRSGDPFLHLGRVWAH